MTPEKTFGQFLRLDKAWGVVEAPDLLPEESARAGTPVTCYDHVETMQWRHLNVFKKECVIRCALPRGRRGNCGTVYRVTPP